MLNDKLAAERERGAHLGRFGSTRQSAPATEYSASQNSRTAGAANTRTGAAGRSRDAVGTTSALRSTYTSQCSSRATSRERGKGLGPTDYERDIMRRRELIALQLAAQDQIKETYNRGGMRAVNTVFGDRLRVVNLPAALRKPAPRRGF